MASEILKTWNQEISPPTIFAKLVRILQQCQDWMQPTLVGVCAVRVPLGVAAYEYGADNRVRARYPTLLCVHALLRTLRVQLECWGLCEKCLEWSIKSSMSSCPYCTLFPKVNEMLNGNCVATDFEKGDPAFVRFYRNIHDIFRGIV